MSDPVNSSAASVAAQSPLSSDGAQADGAAATGTLNADGTVMVDPDTGLAIDATATTQSNGLLGDFTSLPVIEQVDRAGVVGWVLAAMALIGLVVFFYKLVGFLRRGVFADGMTLPVNSAQDREAAFDLIAARARKEIDGLNGGLRIMSAIAVLSPLLGLLGTVMGMIEAFQRMEGAGSRIDPSVLSGGIWLALLTTAIGLVVAIPATAFHMWMQGVIGRAASTMEDVCTLVVNRGELAQKSLSRVSNLTELHHAAE